MRFSIKKAKLVGLSLIMGISILGCTTQIKNSDIGKHGAPTQSSSLEVIEKSAEVNTMLKNGCDFDYLLLKHTPAALHYAQTGVWTTGNRPIHPRAVYMAAFGMSRLLKSYLESHPRERGNSNILPAAVVAGQKDTVLMLLQMGLSPNRVSKATLAPPLFQAAACGRPTIMLYLIQAGANVYEAAGGAVAMAYALVGPGLNHRPFLEGVRLLVAAGFDPRCAVAKNGRTAVDVTRKGLQYDAKFNPANLKNQRKLLRFLLALTKIAARADPGVPTCGGLNWNDYKSMGSLRQAKPGGEGSDLRELRTNRVRP